MLHNTVALHRWTLNAEASFPTRPCAAYSSSYGTILHMYKTSGDSLVRVLQVGVGTPTHCVQYAPSQVLPSTRPQQHEEMP